MDAEQGRLMGEFEQYGEFRQLGDFERLQQMQMQHMDMNQRVHMGQFDVMSTLGQMSQQDIAQMNAVLGQCQLLDNGQLLFAEGAGVNGSGGGGNGTLLATDDPQHDQFRQQRPPPSQKDQKDQKDLQKQQYLQRLYLQQLQLQMEHQKMFDEAARRQAVTQGPSHLQQPFPHEIPPFLNTAPAFAGAAFPQQQQEQLGGGPSNATPPLYHPPQQRASPVTWPNPSQAVEASTGVSAAPLPIGHATVGQQQKGHGRRPSRGRMHARRASASARREGRDSRDGHEHHERHERHERHEGLEQRPLPTAAPSHAPPATNSPADDELLRLQDLSIIHRHEDDAGPAGPASLASSASTATITGPTPEASSTTSSSSSPSRPPQLLYLPSNPPPSSSSHPHPLHSHPHPHPQSVQSSQSSQSSQNPHTSDRPPHPYPYHNQASAASASCSSLTLDLSHPPVPLQPSNQATLSPKKQRGGSTSPKKTGRFENIYATIRNKATSMRRSRTAFMHEAPPPTVAPMATLHDATFPLGENQHIKSHHAHHRSHHSGDVDLDLELSAANGAAMGSFPPTPPLTGTASSLSSTSSTFSMSACSSSASSVGDGPHFHHLVAAQYPHSGLHSHHLNHHHANASEDDLPPADMAAFVTGLVDDPFAENSGFFGGGVGAPGLHQQHKLALRPHGKAEFPPHPASNSNSTGMSSACWPATMSTPNSKISPLQPGDDSDITPVTAAINIPGRMGVPAAVSPSAYLANVTANMSGSSVIASASATAALAAVAANVKRDALDNAIGTDEDWWQESVVESAVGEPLDPSPRKIGEMDPMAGAGTIPSGFPPEFIAANAQAFDANGNLCFYMPDLATQGLMINMPSGASTPGGHNQFYFPGIPTTSAGTGYPPPPPMPSGEYEYRYDRASASSRRPKPRAPSAGARYHSTSRGDGIHSPRKRSSASNLAKTNSSSGSGLYTCDDGSGISAAAMTAPSTPRGHGQLGRRSHSLQALPRTSPTPGASGSMSTLPSGAATPTSHGAIRKRRSASNMRRVSSTQGITSLTAAAAISAAIGGASGVPEPRTPSRRSTSVEARPRSVKSNAGGDGKISFVNMTSEDHDTLMNGVAPSGSSKTKARRERELQERTRQYGERLVRAVHEAGGDVRKIEVEGLSDLSIAL